MTVAQRIARGIVLELLGRMRAGRLTIIEDAKREREPTSVPSRGLTNPEIGERMFISRGTVKVHLSHIYAKLDVRNRSQLAAVATRRPA